MKTWYCNWGLRDLQLYPIVQKINWLDIPNIYNILLQVCYIKTKYVSMDYYITLLISYDKVSVCFIVWLYYDFFLKLINEFSFKKVKTSAQYKFIFS